MAGGWARLAVRRVRRLGLDPVAGDGDPGERHWQLRLEHRRQPPGVSRWQPCGSISCHSSPSCGAMAYGFQPNAYQVLGGPGPPWPALSICKDANSRRPGTHDRTKSQDQRVSLDQGARRIRRAPAASIFPRTGARASISSPSGCFWLHRVAPGQWRGPSRASPDQARAHRGQRRLPRPSRRWQGPRRRSRSTIPRPALYMAPWVWHELTDFCAPEPRS